MDFGATISRALKITWQHKTLWLIMLVPTLAGLIVLIPFFVLFLGAMVAGIASAGGDGRQALEGMLGAGLLAAYCFLFVGYIAIIVLTLVAQGALVEGVRQAEDEGRVRFGESMRVGWKNAGKLFVSGLVISLPIFGILCIGLVGVVAVALPAGSSLGRGNNEEIFAALFSGGLCVFLGLYCVILIYALFASGIYVMGERAIVLHNAGPVEGLRQGWQIFRANFGSIFLLAIVLIGVQLIVSFVLNFGTQILTLPAMGPLTQLGPNAGPEDIQRMFSGLMAASFGLIFVIVLIVSLIWGLLYSIFSSAAWTLAYRQFTGRAANDLTSLPPNSPSMSGISELR